MPKNKLKNFTLEELINLIEHYGSVNAASKALNVARQSLSAKFDSLAEDNPYLIRYKKITNKKTGRPKKFPTTAIANKIRQQKYRNRLKLKQKSQP